jgi:hypothetical protein
VRLFVDGTVQTQPLVVKMDPRVTTPAAELARQHRLSMQLYELLQRDMAALEEVREFRADARNAGRDEAAARIQGRLTQLNGALGSLLRTVEGAEGGPASQVVEAIGETRRALMDVLAEWSAMKR